MKNVLLSVAMLLFSTLMFAQENKSKAFKPSGNPTFKIFTNAHTTFIDGENTSAFELKRAYFGYKHSFSENFSSKVTLDVGNPGAGSKLEMTAYVKTAALTYTKGGLKVNFGLIGLYGFNTQEKHWGYRYIYKSLQDEHKYGSSADLGVSTMYKISDFISLDAMLLNGEGYKNLQGDNTYKGAFGVALTPVKNLTIRAYYDYMRKNEAQQTIALFAGYKAEKFSVGAEYNTQLNNKYTENQDLNGISVYTTIVTSKKFNLFARYDNLTSSTLDGSDDAWNIAKDGQACILGLEYKPVKGVKISPNYQGWSPAEEDAPFESSFYLNFSYSF